MTTEAHTLQIAPTPTSMVEARNQLLQKSLRPEPQDFSIAAEYPLVLADSTHARATSLSVTAGTQIVGHANLFHRTFQVSATKQSFDIGLIGNVTTAATWRGQGVMRLLFQEISKQMQKQELSALILWSDLLEFYQKLGFTSLGHENRYHLLRAGCKKSDPSRFKFIDCQHISETTLRQLLALRMPTYGALERSVSDFDKLIRIPQTYLFVEMLDQRVESFAIVGKGADLIGVIHEWGGPSCTAITNLAGSIMDVGNLDELILLAPRSLDATFDQAFRKASGPVDEVPMALGMKNPHSPTAQAAWDALQKGFLWGLDSI